MVDVVYYDGSANMDAMKATENFHLRAGIPKMPMSDKFVYNRMVIVDHIASIAADFHMTRSTTHLAIHIFDCAMFASQNPEKWVLRGVAALLIAKKIIEVKSPSLTDIIEASDETLSVQHVIQEEANILRIMDWSLRVDTPWDLFWLYLHAHQIHQPLPTQQMSVLEHLGGNILDLVMADAEFLVYTYFELAIAALCLLLPLSTVSNITAGLPWTAGVTQAVEAMKKYLLSVLSKYSMDTTDSCIQTPLLELLLPEVAD